MTPRALAAAVLSLLLLPGLLAAAELSKIERTIAKEPTYRGQPRYCLLVFGPQASTRVWLAQDGDTLYVDRNGNGDLTEPGDKVIAEKIDGAGEGEYAFKVGEVRDGPRLHKSLTVAVSRIDFLAAADQRVKALLQKNPHARGYVVAIEEDIPGYKGTGSGGRVQEQTYFDDAKGVLQFSEQPRDAPVIHFGGPWQITLFDQASLRIGRSVDVVLGVGTPGVGPGTTAYVDYQGVIPAGTYPTLDIVYAPKHPGDPPVRQHDQLKRRC